MRVKILCGPVSGSRSRASTWSSSACFERSAVTGMLASRFASSRLGRPRVRNTNPSASCGLRRRSMKNRHAKPCRAGARCAHELQATGPRLAFTHGRCRARHRRRRVGEEAGRQVAARLLPSRRRSACATARRARGDRAPQPACWARDSGRDRSRDPCADRVLRRPRGRVSPRRVRGDDRRKRARRLL